MDFYKMPLKDIFKHFNIDCNKGISQASRRAYQTKYGKNALPENKSSGFFIRFLSQFKDFMIVILLISAFISGYISYISHEDDYTEPIIILAIVVLNALFGSLQELKAEKSIKALKNCQPHKCCVLIGGRKCKIDATELVPGDIIYVNPGDIVPGDARLIACSKLSVDESCLTGESKNVLKDESKTYKDSVPLFERKNMIYSSTLVTSGYGSAIVVATGPNSEVGHIATLLKKETAPPSPLFLRIKSLSKILGSCCLLICLFVFLLGLLGHAKPLDMFVTSLSLAVAAIPEGLPAATTIMLSIGVTRLAKKRAILKNLSSVETLGKISVICSDKTGTITKNQMSIVGYYDGEKYHTVDQLSYKNDQFKTLLSKALCNSSVADGQGNATEKAILNAYTSLFGPWENQAGKCYEIPFSSDQKTMVSIYHGLDTISVYIKGAFDRIIDHTDLDSCCKRQVTKLHNEVCQNGLRVIACASSILSPTEFFDRTGSHIDNIKNIPAPQIYESLITNMNFDGFLAIIDPPRVEVYDSIMTAKNAGIKTAMITGDHLITAKAIGQMVGIPSDNCLTGSDIATMSSETLREKVKSTYIFARVTPEDKLRLIKAYQENGERVLMTGDGINDAPALKAADIGAAMGQSGTDVARESADLILTDDNYKTIIDAIKGGRAIFENIKKSLHFLLSCNAGEIFTVLFPLLFGLSAPLAATQLLAINLITDSLPAIALGMEKGGAEVMMSSWLNNNQTTFSPLRIFKIVFEGMLIAGLSLIGYICYGSTGCFVILGLTEILHSFNLRDERSIFSRKSINPYIAGSGLFCSLVMLAMLYISPLQKAFSLTYLEPAKLATLICISLSIILVKEIEKKLFA